MPRLLARTIAGGKTAILATIDSSAPPTILNAGPLSIESAILGSAVEVGFGGMNTHSQG
jgi:hypothetical protein